MILFEALCELAVFLDDGLATSTFEIVHGLHIGHGTSLDLASNLATTS